MANDRARNAACGRKEVDKIALPTPLLSCAIDALRASAGAMRLVAEAFPWSERSTFAYTLDNHNSVVGMRGYALAQQASAVAVHIMPSNTSGASRSLPEHVCFTLWDKCGAMSAASCSRTLCLLAAAAVCGPRLITKCISLSMLQDASLISC